MDTREKIVPLQRLPELLRSGEWAVLAGLFDPMTAAQAKRIARHAENGRKLLAIVLEESEGLLPADARAALVASLRAVSAVAIARPGEWQSLLPGNIAVPGEDLDAERARTEEFVQFVLNRSDSLDLGTHK